MTSALVLVETILSELTITQSVIDCKSDESTNNPSVSTTKHTSAKVSWANAIGKGNDTYVLKYIVNEGNRVLPQLENCRQKTRDVTGKYSRMMTAVDQCYFFRWFVRSMNASKAIEVGVFTGSSALSICLGLTENGTLIGIDLNEEWTNIAMEICKKAGVGHKLDIRLGGGITELDALLADAKEIGTYDFAYVDAMKNEYIEYHNRLLSLIRVNGVIAYDNVLGIGKAPFPPSEDDSISTIACREFNKFIQNDSRIDICMISIGDGLTLVRKL